MDTKALEQHAERILRAFGIENTDGCIDRTWPVSNCIRTRSYALHKVDIDVEIDVFEHKTRPTTCRIDIDFILPEEGVLAQVFMDHCAGIEKTPTNHHHEYCAGPAYPDFVSELAASKQTFALSPWNNNMFYIRSEGYPLDEISQSVDHALSLALQFVRHLPELASLRRWKTTDPDVVAKARQIVENADFHETDVDREERAHWLEDRNSFFKGWFYPFNDKGKGTFDTCYKPYFAAIGIEGSFEHAVSCLLLFDKEYIAKARKACWIRKETVTVKY